MSIKEMLSHLWMLFFSALAIAYQYHAKWAWQTRMFKCFRTTRLNKQFLAKIVLWNVRLYEALKWQTKRYKPHIYYIYIYILCSKQNTWWHNTLLWHPNKDWDQSVSCFSINPFRFDCFRCPMPKRSGWIHHFTTPNFSKQRRIPATKQTTHPNKKVVIDMNSPSGPLQHTFTDPIALHVIYQANYYNT